ncbi:hypothetical protein [Vibrio scophthalmi]|uniref:Uncharacterized protein n=1 Tax=Vibrio scophthalmi LMG 19158 TaxID=870967 RepID=F9RK74_9VIBR|nr:hypothetical protein [Vibrio scophthalmi]EGU40076.1 hypothetical protein VIS19158_04801 [Vibrio scophthalmi LMG 19158]
MSASNRAKELGVKRMSEVVEFYGNTAQTMRNVYSRNPKAFDAMVIGYIQVAEKEKQNNLAFML